MWFLLIQFLLFIIRHRFDHPLQYRLSLKTELKIEQEKYLYLIKEEEMIEKEIEEIKQLKLLNKIIDQIEKFIS
jgi:hypothetical protein